jgi:lactoylglutathione lyase
MGDFLHLSLRSRGRDRTSDWYCTNLGFEERRRGTTGLGTHTAILVHPSTETYIEVSDRAYKGHDFQIPEEAILLQFTVPDMEQVYNTLKKNGAEITEGDASSQYIFVNDPDGYEIEISRGNPGEPARFSSIGLRANDLEASTRFYVDGIGFQEQRRWKSERGTEIQVLTLEPGAPTLALRHMPFLNPMPRIPEDLMHLAFPVDNMASWIPDMRSRGFTVDEDNPRMSWMADPDGYELEMIETRREG